MPIYINDSGILRESKPHINVNGVIKEVQEGWQNDGGVLRKFYSSSTELVLLGAPNSAGIWTVDTTNGNVTSHTDTRLAASAAVFGNGSGVCRAESISIDFVKYSHLTFSGDFRASGSATTIRSVTVGGTVFPIEQGIAANRTIDISDINITGTIIFQCVGAGPTGGTASFDITSVILIP